jgi:predicted nuclease with TOPRIM domain
MQQQIQTRLEVLKAEFETGQAKLRELETEQAHLRETLLRISGAIQVLQEILRPARTAENSESSPSGESLERLPEG